MAYKTRSPRRKTRSPKRKTRSTRRKTRSPKRKTNRKKSSPRHKKKIDLQLLQNLLNSRPVSNSDVVMPIMPTPVADNLLSDLSNIGDYFSQKEPVPVSTRKRYVDNKRCTDLFIDKALNDIEVDDPKYEEYLNRARMSLSKPEYKDELEELEICNDRKKKQHQSLKKKKARTTLVSQLNLD